MRDPEVDVELESRLEEADRDREYLRGQLAKYTELVVEIRVRLLRADMKTESIFDVLDLIDQSVWTYGGKR